MGRFTHIILVTLTGASLSACGGGSGGGGSSDGGGSSSIVDGSGNGDNGSDDSVSVPWNPPPAPLNAGNGPSVLNINNVTPVGTLTFANLSPSGVTGVHIAKTTDGLVLTTALGADNRSVTLSVSEGDFKDSGAFITAVKETLGKTSMANGSFHARDTIILGGQKLGLQHSDFGIWNEYVRYAFSDGSTLSETRSHLPIYMGDPSKKAAFQPGAGNVVFTGATVADLSNNVTMAGTASLTVDQANLGSSSAQLNFANFYNFNIPVAVNTDGSFVKGAGAVTSTNTGNTTGVDMSSGNIASSASFKGQFYGPAANNPQEAVGSYQIFNNDLSWKVLNGSFGVKR